MINLTMAFLQEMDFDIKTFCSFSKRRIFTRGLCLVRLSGLNILFINMGKKVTKFSLVVVLVFDAVSRVEPLLPGLKIAENQKS